MNGFTLSLKKFGNYRSCRGFSVSSRKYDKTFTENELRNKNLFYPTTSYFITYDLYLKTDNTNFNEKEDKIRKFSYFMSKKSIKNMNNKEKLRNSLSAKTVRSTVKSCIIFGLICQLVALTFFTVSLTNQYINVYLIIHIY